jgi:hypothetical protein
MGAMSLKFGALLLSGAADATRDHDRSFGVFMVAA